MYIYHVTITLSEIERCVNDFIEDCVSLGGDMNMDLSRNNAHSNLLADMCEWHGLQFGWLHNSHPTFTYISSDLRSRSTIDHFVFSSEIDNTINNVYVQISWHRPIYISLNMNISTISV